MATNIHKMDTWNLIWIVVCSDTIIKFMVICVKSIVTLVPLTIIPMRRRGSFYSAIEAFALFYRSLTPIHPWILYILYYETNIQISTLPIDNTKLDKQIFDESSSITSAGHTWSGFSTLLCVMYIVFKLNQLYNRFVDLQTSFTDILNDTVRSLSIAYLLDQLKQVLILLLSISGIWSASLGQRSPGECLSYLSGQLQEPGGPQVSRKSAQSSLQHLLLSPVLLPPLFAIFF